MTRDEILNMPAGREMDALIAEKVFGFHSIKMGKEYPTRCFGIPRQWHRQDKSEIIKTYSTDIAAAWEVVEKLANPESVLSARIIGEYADHGWRAIFENAFVNYDVEADTAPLAICRAALLAVMETETK